MNDLDLEKVQEPVNKIMEMDQYLTFTLDRELYAVNVMNIQEVLEYQSISRVPGMPEYMMGIINLRGSVVPVFDLKLELGLGKTERTTETGIIVAELQLDKTLIEIGLLADSVHEVVELRNEDMEQAPNIGINIDTSFIRGMGKQKDDFILILDVRNVLSNQKITSYKSGEIGLTECESAHCGIGC